MSKFLRSYIIYAAILAVLAAAAIIYVNVLLKDYEAARPERQVEAALSDLKAQATDKAAFWQTYQLPTVTGGEYEQHIDIQTAYLALYEKDVTITQKVGAHAEDELVYILRSGDFPLAEVVLKAKGPARTQLLVFSTREWAVQSVRPLLEAREYTVTLPKGFTAGIGGKALSAKPTDDGKQVFKVSGVYLEPQFTIADANGATAAYTVKNFRLEPQIYDYTLTLPSELTVMVNGAKSEGETLADGRIRYAVASIEKPQMTVADVYGNTVQYEGDSLPLTYLTVRAPSDYTVTADGKAVAKATKVLAEYAFLEGTVANLPSTAEMTVAVLKENATVAVTDGKGTPVALEEGKQVYDFTAPLPAADAVPVEIASKVDVLKVAQHWSLFMSNDRTFKELATEMLPGSYQYEVAQKYATGPDKNFFSAHTLLDPAFTDNRVSNFVRLSEDCFSVDVQFTKRMRLPSGKVVNDPMNDRFYFVNKDGAWLLAGMKEVTDNG